MNTVASDGERASWLPAGRGKAASTSSPTARRQERAIAYFPGGLPWPRTPVRMRNSEAVVVT